MERGLLCVVGVGRDTLNGGVGGGEGCSVRLGVVSGVGRQDMSVLVWVAEWCCGNRPPHSFEGGGK